VSRMTTRTKIGVCVGLLVVVVVGVMLWSLRAESPAVRVGFVRYMDGGAVLNFTNQRQSALAGFAMNVVFCSERGPPDYFPFFYLLPRCGTQLVVRPRPTTPPPGGGIESFAQLLAWIRASRATLPTTASVLCMEQHSKRRQRVEALLAKVGIDIASTGFVATVTLPPRPAATSSGPTNQSAP